MVDSMRDRKVAKPSPTGQCRWTGWTRQTRQTEPADDFAQDNMGRPAQWAASHWPARNMHRLHPVTRAMSAVVVLVLGMLLPASAASAASAQQTTRLDLRVLVVDDGSPWSQAIASELSAEGVPFTDVPLGVASRPTIDSAFLSSGDEGFYQAVVLPNEMGGSLSGAELAALHAYEATFGVRQVDAYTWANPGVGLNYAADPGFIGPLDGKTALVTTAGRTSGFGYLNGPIPFSPGSYGFLATPLAQANLPAGATYQTLVSMPIPGTTAAGSVIGDYANAGVDQLVITASLGFSLLQFKILAHGIVTWATRGVHLGYDRNYFTVQVDDIFNSDALWNAAHDCTPGEDCPRNPDGTSIYPEVDARMVPSDVAYAVDWQARHNFQMTLVFNAGLSSPSDPLTQALLANKDSFYWVNHTWDHAYLGCIQDLTVIPWRCVTDPTTGATQWMDAATIEAEISQNITWAQQNGVPFNPSEIVTGDYSGLAISPQQPQDNPNFVTAVTALGLRAVASDASREPNQRQVGSALTVPRHPINIFYNASTVSAEVSEYNWLYTSPADGGGGYCTNNPLVATCIAPLNVTTGFSSYIVPLETAITMGQILSNDPRPIMIHQTNLTGDRIMYPVLDSVLSAYRSAMNASAPVESITLDQAAQLLFEQTAWNKSWSSVPGSTPEVQAYVQDGQVHLALQHGTLSVPMTAPTGTTVVTTTGTPIFGHPYAGEQSAWLTLGSGSPVTLRLPPSNDGPSVSAPIGHPVSAMAPLGNAAYRRLA